MEGSGFCTVITESHGRGIRCQGAAISKLAGFKRLVHYGRFSCCTSGTLTIYYVAFCVAHLKQLFRIAKMLLLLLLLLLPAAETAPSYRSSSSQNHRGKGNNNNDTATGCEGRSGIHAVKECEWSKGSGGHGDDGDVNRPSIVKGILQLISLPR